MTLPTHRFAARLLVPALAIGAIVALGEPIEASSHAEFDPTPAPELHGPPARPADFALALALQQEADLIREEAEAAKKAARQTAAQMRWVLTLPAAGARRGDQRDSAS